jgi:acyl-CoA thioester hydrolase
MGVLHPRPQPCGGGECQNVYNPERLSMALPDVSEIQVRVNYSETDQMGVVYHARYLVWLDIARTEHLRLSGTSYRDLELQGFRLAVSEVSIRYRQPARFDDVIRVRCWVRAIATRRVEFGYALERSADGMLLATASTSLLSLSADMRLTAMPKQVRAALRSVPDPVRLGLHPVELATEVQRTQSDES